MTDPSVSAATAIETPSTAQTVQMENRLFDALQREDRAAWDLLVGPDFQAFERGKIYDSAAFFGLVAALHRSGAQAQWSVTNPRVISRDGLVVMSYVNSGSLAMAGEAPKPMRWLETVAFRKDLTGWKAVLVTSMRVADEITAPIG